jgi:Uncharacterized protein conserved in bacteria (DUF2188)
MDFRACFCAGAALPAPCREKIMADARYYVVRDHGGWVIKFEDEHYGPYPSHDDAVRIALDGARKLGSQGECAHVCMAGDDGHFQPRWSYGRGEPELAGA